jgi:hypothetical protein
MSLSEVPATLIYGSIINPSAPELNAWCDVQETSTLNDSHIRKAAICDYPYLRFGTITSHCMMGTHDIRCQGSNVPQDKQCIHICNVTSAQN